MATESNENEIDASRDNPYEKSGVISPDEQAWVRDRLLTLTRVARTVESEGQVRADDRIIEDAIEGAVNGTAVEIANTLGLQVEGDNIKRPWRVEGNRDEHLRWSGDE